MFRFNCWCPPRGQHSCSTPRLEPRPVTAKYECEVRRWSWGQVFYPDFMPEFVRNSSGLYLRRPGSPEVPARPRVSGRQPSNMIWSAQRAARRRSSSLRTVQVSSGRPNSARQQRRQGRQILDRIGDELRPGVRRHAATTTCSVSVSRQPVPFGMRIVPLGDDAARQIRMRYGARTRSKPGRMT